LLEANFASLAQIYRYAAGGQPSATRARQVGDGAQRTLAPALHALHEVSDDYAESARTDQRESVVGSIAAVLALAAAFAFFYRRSAAAHQSLRAREQSLRATLADLERAQAERKRLLARTVEVAEQERIRVADDLHDGPIQQLTVISLRLEMLANQIASACPDAEEKLRDLRADVANEMVSLRRLMSDLRPPILDRGGLSAALQDCADKVIDTALTSCEVRSRIGGARLAAEIETVVYRVTREALVNVRKHAEATHVEVSLDRDGDDLRLVIADDGRGFESGELARRVRENHFGFLALQERIEAVGGRWRINSGAGAGTRIEALIPWKPHAV
jgi:signal transduction histidine kinase